MVFSSNLFIFGFIPVFFLLYYATSPEFRNFALAIGSLVFYAFGSGPIVSVLLFSIFFNHALGLAIDSAAGRKRDILFIFSTLVNVGFLLYYKYATFFAMNLRALLGSAGLPDIGPFHPIALPIGISFYTFQAISYTADIYTRHIQPARRLVDFAAYHTLFPQLIAGPIVRYSEVVRFILVRPLTLEDTTYGIYRFNLGLAKKILVADPMGTIADHVFDTGPTTPTLAWLGAIAYTLQIYFDFSGYSDMAIGLGRMLGFKFPENFNQPYRAQNITEFWRRWHMTLSRWFRDYVYIPLGGNRRSRAITYRNLVGVFFLCGLWHGAGWTFVMWGLYHGLLLMLERMLHDRLNFRGRGMAGIAITFLLTVVGWVIFRSKSMAEAWNYLRMMSGLLPAAPQNYSDAAALLSPDKVVVLLSGFLFAWFPFERITWARDSEIGLLTRYGSAFALLVLSLAAMSTATFNPFIYFRF